MQAENIDYLQTTIAQRAYEISQQRNGSGGDPLSDWLQAEREVLAAGNDAAAPAAEVVATAVESQKKARKPAKPAANKPAPAKPAAPRSRAKKDRIE